MLYTRILTIHDCDVMLTPPASYYTPHFASTIGILYNHGFANLIQFIHDKPCNRLIQRRISRKSMAGSNIMRKCRLVVTHSACTCQSIERQSQQDKFMNLVLRVVEWHAELGSCTSSLLKYYAEGCNYIF